MSISHTRSAGILAVALLVAFAVAGEAFAQGKSKSTQSEAVWVKFDPENNTVTARIRKAGKGAKPPSKLKLKKGREAEFNVIPTGSILKRTSVAVNGQKGEITDIVEGKTVNIYWVQDPKDPEKRFARKIDVIMSQEEFDARYDVAE